MTQAQKEAVRKSGAIFLPYLLLFLPVLVNFYPVLSGRLIFVERDLGTYFIPPRFLWVKLAKSLTFPLWNPHNYSGIPLLATLQPGVLYPPHVLYFFLPFNLAWNWLILLHYFFAGVTTYLLLNHLRASRAASFTGAITFLLSGYLLSLQSLVTHLFAASWFPLVILSFLKYLDHSRARDLVMAALCLCMLFLSGAPETLFIALVVLLFIALFGSSLAPTLTRYQGPKSFCLLCVLFGLLSSVQLLPFLELKSLSIRQGGLSYWEATLWSFGLRDFIQFFVDDAFGAFRNLGRYWQNQAWLKSVYMGAVPFVLSFFFFLSKDRKRPLFLALMIVSLVLALGGNTPLYRLLYHVPPFDGLRYPVKFLFLFVFVLALSTGLGFDRLRALGQTNKEKARALARVVFAVGLLLAFLLAYMTLFHARVYHFFDARGFKPDTYNLIEENLRSIERFLLFFFFLCACLVLYFKTRSRMPLYTIIFLLFLDLLWANFGVFRTSSWQAYVTPPPFAEIVGDSSLGRYVLDAGAAEELYAFPQNRAALAPAYAGLFGLYAASGSEVMKVAHQDAFLEMIKKSPSLWEAGKFLRLGGIKYVITIERIMDRRFRLIKSISAESAKRADKVPVYLYEYEDYPGRAFLVGKGRFLTSDVDIGKAIEKGSSNPREEIILYGRALHEVNSGLVTGEAHVVVYGPNRAEIAYRADRGCFLYFSDTYYPGWRAYVDGRRTTIYRANLAFRALSVPKGTHRVAFRYAPLSFYTGLGLTLMGICLAAFLLWKGGRTEGKRPAGKR